MFRKLLKDLVYFVFPQDCPGCGKSLVEGEEQVCISCLTDAEQTGFHLAPAENELYFRFAGKVPLHGAASLFYFDKKGKVQRMISALKYQHSPQIGEFLGRFYAHQIKASEFIRSVDCIVPVPLHWSREADRGYNQSTAFGKGLSAGLGIPLRTDILKRTSKTETQTRKGKQERFENVQEVFAVPVPCAGSILLVDDVITTGATLEACIRVLNAQPEPPRAISVASIAIARGH